jgi:hypothetical protein
MARQRVLTDSVKADIDGAKSAYDLVRILRINLDIGQVFDKQRMLVDWAVGRLEDGVFIHAPFNNMSGTISYDNTPPYAFGQFLQKVLPLGIGPFLDEIFADLEKKGLIKAGTQEDYGLAPGT